jgi:hypothetical protein
MINRLLFNPVTKLVEKEMKDLLIDSYSRPSYVDLSKVNTPEGRQSSIPNFETHCALSALSVMVILDSGRTLFRAFMMVCPEH